MPCSSSTLPHINTNIHPSKQTPSCIHNFYCTLTALTNSSFFTTATLLFCAFLQPNPGPTHPSISIRSMLTPEHVTALNDLTDNHNPDIITLTETWIRSFTTPAQLIDSTPPGYSLFSDRHSYTGNPSKPILAGGTDFLRTFLSEFCCSTLFFIRIFIHNSKIFQSSTHTVQHLSTTPPITILSTLLYLC